jgi:hypothetical protein
MNTNGWISTKEQNPKNLQEVLIILEYKNIYLKSNTGRCRAIFMENYETEHTHRSNIFITENRRFEAEEKLYFAEDVLYWMPLPPLPKDVLGHLKTWTNFNMLEINQ